MPLYLIRHAHALAAETDRVRPLSAKGRAQVRRMAKFLRASRRFAPAEIWHSPLVRTVETAKLLGRHRATTAPSRAMAGLAPESNPRIMGRRLAATRKSVALVGHEPHLSALASWLVAGRAEPAIFELKKGSVLALERTDAGWVVGWQISPGLLGRKKRQARRKRRRKEPLAVRPFSFFNLAQ